MKTSVPAQFRTSGVAITEGDVHEKRKEQEANRVSKGKSKDKASARAKPK